MSAALPSPLAAAFQPPLVAAPGAQPLEAFTPNPAQWLIETHRFITGSGLKGSVETLATALVACLFAYGAIRAGYFGRSSELKLLFGRLFIAGALLTALAPVRTVAQGTWTNVYAWSSSLWHDKLNGELTQAGLNLGEEIGSVTLAGAVARAGVGLASEAVAGKVIQGGAAAAAQETGTDLAKNLLSLSSVLVTPLFAVYAALVFLSGLVVALALTFLPLSAALFLLPGGAAYLSRWLGAYAGALFTVAFLPLVFGISLDLGLIHPMLRLHQEAAQITGQLNQVFAATSAATAQASGLGKVGAVVSQVSNFLQGGWRDTLQTAAQDVANLVLAWVMGLLGTLVGLVVAAFLMLNLERQVAAFVGGIVNAVARPAGMGLAAFTRLGERLSGARPEAPGAPGPAPVQSRVGSGP
ncbi:MAG TPA: hypothetical protein VHN99_00900 [Deinococcales bacterium]|nr:hypothetical protein [Deinococcales bacterium]